MFNLKTKGLLVLTVFSIGALSTTAVASQPRFAKFKTNMLQRSAANLVPPGNSSLAKEGAVSHTNDSTHVWTKEEMENAKPYPMPIIEYTPTPGPVGPKEVPVDPKPSPIPQMEEGGVVGVPTVPTHEWTQEEMNNAKPLPMPAPKNEEPVPMAPGSFGNGSTSGAGAASTVGIESL